MNPHRWVSVPSGHCQGPSAFTNWPRRASRVHTPSTRIASSLSAAATATVANSTPATLAASSTLRSRSSRRSSSPAIIRARLSGTPTVTSSSPTVSCQRPSTWLTTPRSTKESTTLTMNSGLPSVRW
jgi:hypothetical protein